MAIARNVSQEREGSGVPEGSADGSSQGAASPKPADRPRAVRRDASLEHELDQLFNVVARTKSADRRARTVSNQSADGTQAPAANTSMETSGANASRHRGNLSTSDFGVNAASFSSADSWGSTASVGGSNPDTENSSMSAGGPPPDGGWAFANASHADKEPRLAEVPGWNIVIESGSVDADRRSGSTPLDGSHGTGNTSIVNNVAADEGREVAESARRLDHGPVLPLVPGFEHIELWAGGHGQGSAADELNSPTKVFLAADGTLYVSDMGNHRVQAWRTPLHGDYSGQMPETVAGGTGPGHALNQLNFPMGLTMDPSGNLYVADSMNNRVMRWAQGATVGIVAAGWPYALRDKQDVIYGFEEWCCRAGSDVRQLADPQDVVLDSSSFFLYVADTGNNRVQRWDTSGQVLTVASGLRRPASLALFSDSVLYVADTGNNRVLAFPPGATEGTIVAGGGTGVASLTVPSDVKTMEKDGGRELYVCDTYNHRIMRYFLGANLLDSEPGALDSEPELVAGGCLDSPDYIQPCIQGGLHDPPDPGPDRVDHLNPSNTNPPIYHFFGPRGVFVQSTDTERHIVVADTSNHRVLAHAHAY